MPEQPLNEQSEPKRSHWLNIGILISTFGLILFVCAFGFGYFQLAHTTLRLSNAVTNIERITVANQKELQNLKSSVQDLQKGLENTEALSQRQEKLLKEWEAAQTGNLEKWKVAEAQYLVKLANDRLQFVLDVNEAKMLLKRADQVLSTVQDATVLEIRKSLAKDILTLESMPQADLTSIYVRMAALNAQIQKLRLPTDMVPPTAKTSEPVATSNEGWWRRGFRQLWSSLREVIIVRNINAVPVVSPEEKQLLYLNLQTQIENATWGLLHHNITVYQTGLTRAIDLIERYFLKDDPVTQAVLTELKALQEINIQVNAADLSATLALFDQYFKQAQTQSSVPAATSAAPATTSPGTQNLPAGPVQTQ